MTCEQKQAATTLIFPPCGRNLGNPMYHGADGQLTRIWHKCEDQMSSLSQQPLSRPLEDTTRPTKSAAFLLIAGGILIAASLFLTWLHLSTSHGDGPHEVDFDPWTAIHFNAGNSVFILVLVLLLAGWGIVIGSVILAFSRSMRLRRALTVLVIALACLYGGGMVLTVGVMSVGSSLSWPYYNVTTQYGLAVVVLGYLSVVVGALKA
jgi:hypothetical protein